MLGGVSRTGLCELSHEASNSPTPTGIINSPPQAEGGDAPTGWSVDPGLGMGPLRTSLPLLATGSVAAQGPKAMRLGRIIGTENPTDPF